MSSAEEGVAPKSGGAAHRYPGARNPEFRRVLVTGANGKVGVRVVQAFHKDSSGKPWEVVATDVSRGVFDTPGADDPWNYQQADLTDAGEVFSMVARFQPDAVVHIAAIPDIEHNAPHTVFANNITATFNGASALRCIRGACVRSPATANSCCARVWCVFAPLRSRGGVRDVRRAAPGQHLLGTSAGLLFKQRPTRWRSVSPEVLPRRRGAPDDTEQSILTLQVFRRANLRRGGPPDGWKHQPRRHFHPPELVGPQRTYRPPIHFIIQN